MITAPGNAPNWAHDFARTADAALQANSWPFISKTPYLVAELTATLAALYPFRFAIVSNGAGNKLVAISNGSAFYYLEGTAV